ncbi:MAG: hypothetical protein K2L51_01775, partial [Clostridiales bacterium]|nr:hypothetical protein [Clostridiales bacterium]
FVNSFGSTVALFSVAVLHPSSSVRATSLRLTAHRAVQNYKMTVELRRLLPDVDSITDDATYLFSAGSNNAEVIRIHFEITVTFNQAGLFSPSAGANHPPYENPVSVLIDSRMTTDPVFLRDYCTVEVSSSRPTVATATIASDNNTILFDLLSSGTTYIEYTVTVNASNGAYVYKDSFQVNVITLVSLAKTVNVSSREEVALDDLKNEIARVMSGMQDADASNDSFYESLSLDKSDPAYPNGYYFESTSGTSSVDSENVWEKIESIPFLDVSLGDDDRYIGMRIKQFNSAQTQAITRIVMLFTDGTRTYRASFRVAPAVKVMKDTVDQMENGDLILEINKGDGTISIANRGENGIQAATDNKFVRDGGMFTLPWEFFASAIDSNIVNKEYEILVVRAQSFDGTVNYSKYVRAMPNGLGTAVCLTPLYPTDGCNVQVSLREKGVANATVTTLNFTVRVTGIKTVLSTSEYRTVLLAVFFSVLALLIIIFFIRMGIYWRKKAEQRRIIKKNQTLIKMREKMHNKTEAVSKEKLVHTKLKMEDPKYAKMFSEMRKEKEAQTGISLENSVIAGKAERKAKAAKASKKKGGKKSIEELQAELAAKREAVARMQMGDFSAVPDMTAASDIPVEGAVTMPVDDISVDGVPLDEQVPVFDAEAGFDGMSAEELDAQFKAAMGDMPFDTDNNNDNGNQG